MSDPLALEFLLDRGTDAEAQARAGMTALRDARDRDAPSSPDAGGEFRFRGLGPNHLSPSASSTLEHFAVPEVPYLELQYDDSPFTEAILEDGTVRRRHHGQTHDN